VKLQADQMDDEARKHSQQEVMALQEIVGKYKVTEADLLKLVSGGCSHSEGVGAWLCVYICIGEVHGVVRRADLQAWVGVRWVQIDWRHHSYH
jgi:hypothetical protein